MAVDMKNIRVGVFTYVKNHPILPVVISFLFILYVFIRSLFVFLVFALPIFVFIAVSFRLIFRIHQENLRNAKGDTNTYDSSSRKLTPSIGGRNLDKRGFSYAHAQSVRRRNSRKNEMHVHFQDEKNMVSSTVNDNAFVDKAALVEETPKEVREVEVGSGLRGDGFNGKRLVFEGGNSDEDGKKAIEWSEDDQKNLIDLGFSEIERNKRLESLMAKRKARKLLTLQVRKTLMNIRRDDPSSEIASILIPKMGNKSSEALISPTPGSAPSVLLPVHNPFDIPYDPQEEKPNLSGDFQEDSVENQHNEAVFCRHESFSLRTMGPWELYSPSETSHHLEYAIRPKVREIPEFSRFRNQSDKKDHNVLTETDTSLENETIQYTNSSHDSTQQIEASENALQLNDVHNGDSTKEIKDESKLETYDIHESSSSSSSEINTPFSTANKDEILRSLSFSLRKNVPTTKLDTNVRTYYENPSPFEKNQGDDHKGSYNIHTRSHSIASDLQVELSEVGSQSTNLSPDGESPKYNVEGNFENEDIWFASSQLKKDEENEARSGEVREVSEEDIIEVGFSRINQDIEEPVDLESSQSHSDDSVNKVYDDILAKGNLALHQNNVDNLEETANSAETIAMDEMIVYEIIDRKDLLNDDQGIIDLIEDSYGEDLDCVNQGTPQDISSLSFIQDKKSVDNVEENSTQPENDESNSVPRQSEPHFIDELLSDSTGNNNSQAIDVVAENGPSEASYSRSTTEDKDPSILLEKTTEGIGLINIANAPTISNLSNPSLARPIEPVMFLGIDPAPIAVIPEVTVEQVAVDSSPSSSPNSVLQHKFSVDNLATNMSFDDIQMASQQSNAETEQNDNFQEYPIAEHAHAGYSAGLQEPPFPHTNYAGDELVQKSDDQVGSITPMEESKKVETIEANEEIPRSKDFQGHFELDDVIDNSESVGVVESHSGNLAVSEVSEK